MSWRLRLSVETLLRLTPAVLGSTVFSIAGLCAAHACLDDQALLAAREAIGSSLQTLQQSVSGFSFSVSVRNQLRLMASVDAGCPAGRTCFVPGGD